MSLILRECRQTFEMSLDDATEAFVPDDLVEAITNRRESDVDVDMRSHFSLHLSAQRQPTGCQQYRLSQLVQQFIHLHKQSLLIDISSLSTIHLKVLQQISLLFSSHDQHPEQLSHKNTYQ